MIDLSKHGGLLRNWFDDKLYELIRIYKASEHKFTRKSFEDNCANKGPTLSVVQAENGALFGGFTTKNWIRPLYDTWTEDSQSWIFSFDRG